MEREQTKNILGASARCAALRHGGAPASPAAAELTMDARRAKRLEPAFQRPKAAGPHLMMPLHANNGRRARELLREGGFPVWWEKRSRR